eukprot:TRINITY_DN40589_c0_g1_i1.p1 TRINITY_DN40589_c0_g1~~TRINITY_DN40589_c0_g1_i1.p1  ORF type:complete len:1417 (+),score=230.05 TRINITY_DN40589_c0_g1_i1:77-4327(+)
MAAHFSTTVILTTLLLRLSGGDDLPMLMLTPQILPAGHSVALSIRSSGEQEMFSANDAGGFSLHLTQPGSAVNTTGACTLDDEGGLRCNASFPQAGRVLAELRSNGVLRTTFLVKAHGSLEVLELLPQELPKAGGARSLITLAKPVEGLEDALGISEIGVVKFQCLSETGELRTSYMKFSLDINGTAARGRTPTLECPGNSPVEALLSLDGQSFEPTRVAGLRAVQKETMKVGFLLIGSPDDNGWNFQHNSARLHLEDAFAGQVEIWSAEEVSTWGEEACTVCPKIPGWDASRKGWADEPADFYASHESAQIMFDWVTKGVKLVFATSFWFQWDVWYMAGHFSNVTFVHVSGWLTRPNMANLFPKAIQGRYVSGILMGLYLKANPQLKKRVGYISAFKLGETVRAINAFKLGLERVDPEIEVYLTWVQTWEDMKKESLAVRRLIEFYEVAGMTHHTDHTVTSSLAHQYGIVSVGYNSDMLFSIGDSVLSSVLLQWETEYSKIVQAVLDGNSDIGSLKWIGIEEGGWVMSQYSPLLTTEVRVEMENIRKELMNGSTDLFCKPEMKDNKGRVRNGRFNPVENPLQDIHLKPGTTCLTDDYIRESCQRYNGFQCEEHWLLEGVHESCASSPSKPEGIWPSHLGSGTCYLGLLEETGDCPSDSGEHLTLNGCVPARAGFYAAEAKELPCPKGSTSVAGSSRCHDCQGGRFAPSLNSTNCTACEPGSFGNLPGLHQCLPCAPGHFVSTSGARECVICPPGRFSTEGASVCSECETVLKGSTSEQGAATQSECVCPAGTFKDGSLCSNCPLGMTCMGGEEQPRNALRGTSLICFVAACFVQVLFLLQPLRRMLHQCAARMSLRAFFRSLFRAQWLKQLRSLFICDVQETNSRHEIVQSCCQIFVSSTPALCVMCFLVLLYMQATALTGSQMEREQAGVHLQGLTWSWVAISLVCMLLHNRPELIQPRTLDIWLFSLGAVGIFSLSYFHMEVDDLLSASMITILPRLMLCTLPENLIVTVLLSLGWYGHILARTGFEAASTQQRDMIESTLIEFVCFLMLTVCTRLLLVAKVLEQIRSKAEQQAWGDACSRLLSLTCDVVVKLDHELRLAEPAPELAALLLLQSQSLLGRELSELLSSSALGRDHTARVLHRAFQQSSGFTCQLQAQDSCGSDLELDIFTVKFSRFDGQPLLLVGIRELTDDQKPAPLRRFRAGSGRQGAGLAGLQQQPHDASLSPCSGRSVQAFGSEGTISSELSRDLDYDDDGEAANSAAKASLLSQLHAQAKFASFAVDTKKVLKCSEPLERFVGDGIPPDIMELFEGGPTRDVFSQRIDDFVAEFVMANARLRSFRFPDLCLISHQRQTLPVQTTVFLYSPEVQNKDLTGFILIRPCKKNFKSTMSPSTSPVINSGSITQLGKSARFRL